MFKRRSLRVALLACAVGPFLQGGAAAPEADLSEGMYVNCEYRVAARFPSAPSIRDFIYSDGRRSAPAREFYVERESGRLSVTVIHFADGPEQDPELVRSAAESLRRRGEVRFDYSVYYDEPTIPGHQINVALSNGRVLRGSVYMADQRLYITEAVSAPNDFPAFLFEQSVSLIDENGIDRDTNPVNLATNAPGTSAGLPPRQYDCSRR